MDQSVGGSGGPQAIIHKQILEFAEANPNASVEEIAEEVTGATIDLVDRVLQKYVDSDELKNGDKEPDSAANREDSSDALNVHKDSIGDTMSDADTEKTNEGAVTTNDGEQTETSGETKVREVPSPSELSEKQTDALRLIERHPSATQRELAEKLDVTAATVSRRLNDIPGFAWDQRQEIVSQMFNTDGTKGTIRDGTDKDEDGHRDDREDQIEALRQRVEDLEQQTRHSSEQDVASGLDVELLHKVIHACMASENITEEEELEVLDGLIGNGR